MNEQIKALKLNFKDVHVNEIEEIGKIAIFTAGTSNIPVAEEAYTTARFLGLEVLKLYGVGIACIYRLVEPLKKVKDENVDVIIAIAGMEGALPSVLAGLVDISTHIGLPLIPVLKSKLEGNRLLIRILEALERPV